MQNCVIGFMRKCEIVLFISHTKDEEGKNTKFEIKKPKKKERSKHEQCSFFSWNFRWKTKRRMSKKKEVKRVFFCRNFI